MHVGDRVMPRDGQATGTLEEIRPSSAFSDGYYMVAEVLWDSGARCAEPLSWLGRLEDVQAANQAREAEGLSAIARDRLMYAREWAQTNDAGARPNGVFERGPAPPAKHFGTSLAPQPDESDLGKSSQSADCRTSMRGERPDSNRRPPGPQPGALPAELRPPRPSNLA
jgi:hypothetical protein